MIHVLIVDDFPIVRIGVRGILENFPDEFVVYEEESGFAAVTNILNNNYDVVILDISMPGKNGLEILKEVKQVKPKLAVLMLSMHPEEQYAIKAIKSGAAGYIPKSNAPEELVIAVRRAASGMKYVSPVIQDKLLSDFTGSPPDPTHHKLSKRELEIMCMIANGRRAIQIAEELKLSAKTVSTYRTRVMRKMNFQSTSDIIRYALQNGLIESLSDLTLRSD